MKITIRDRNHISYLLALNFICTFVESPRGLDAVFECSPELDQANKDYLHNSLIPVQSFVTASRYVSDQIKAYRIRGAAL